ncbi:MAG: hypothetical protein JNK87_15105 [Bryobacterales bacterium]|nr:hypothetical protein [Bryobacterales bacterium]
MGDEPEKLAGYSSWVVEECRAQGREDEPLAVTVRMTADAVDHAAAVLENTGLQLEEQFGDIVQGYITPRDMHRLTELPEVARVEVAPPARMH